VSEEGSRSESLPVKTQSGGSNKIFSAIDRILDEHFVGGITREACRKFIRDKLGQ